MWQCTERLRACIFSGVRILRSYAPSAAPGSHRSRRSARSRHVRQCTLAGARCRRSQQPDVAAGSEASGEQQWEYEHHLDATGLHPQARQAHRAPDGHAQAAAPEPWVRFPDQSFAREWQPIGAARDGGFSGRGRGDEYSSHQRPLLLVAGWPPPDPAWPRQVALLRLHGDAHAASAARSAEQRQADDGGWGPAPISRGERLLCGDHDATHRPHARSRTARPPLRQSVSAG